MAKFYEDCKNWISLIQNLNLENINLKSIQDVKHDAESNKYIFKILLHLSHCADKCYKEKLSKENLIFNITNVICENLTIVADKNKLFSALYYILYYLLSKQAFKEAKIISNYLLPGRIINPGDFEESSKYYQLASLWQTELIKKLDTLLSKSAEKEVIIDEEFISYVMFHLKILNLCDEKCYYTFLTAEVYVRKLANIPLTAAFPCLEKIFKHLSNYMRNLKKISIVNAYGMLIVIIGLAFYKRNDAINNSDILQCFIQCDTYFHGSLAHSFECCSYYKLLREYSMNLFETNFMSNKIGESRFKKSFAVLEALLSKYGTQNNSIIETVTVISYSFEIVFNNWENLVSTQLKNTKISYDDIADMGDFVKRVYSILKKRDLPTNYVCKKCPEPKNCLVKKDIYTASVAISFYIKVLTKVNQDNLNKKIFTVAKELLEQMVSAVNELDTLSCKYAASLWDQCGRLIFNIGLISETKYPAELEGLYKVLCTQIVRRDGINSKLSSFGLENPVGTTLHRLCNSNFNQEKYRKAMSYAAYNALLSNYENRKKKACDMWANIKFKLKDSKEIQELTMLKCLKTDVEIVKKLGISINLEDYNLDDLCLRELKSLFVMKGNVISSMKTTLNELESRNSNLHYAKGVLLLCFHALQLNKREFISDYISKAIERLKKCNQKTASNQCLLANLNFFSIIEKLYARSQVVSKQMEDANFTIKAFKLLKGNQVNNEIDNEEEVVPTFGGINIEEDKKCAYELRDVLSMWESCIQNNILAITNDWEPKLTLETIIFCGEYCRLYKFNIIEEKSWKLAHKLATTLQDFTTCIYVTSRSISLRCINDAWISDATKYVETINNSSKTTETDVVTLFWLSLADFYLDCKKNKEAKELIDKVKSIPNFDILGNGKLYIYFADIQFRNYYTLNSKASQEGYCQLIVEIHYLMINMYDMMSQEVCRFWSIKFQLFAYEQMFETLCDMVVPMNSLLSYREISLHLMRGLNSAQKLGMSLRIAECIKYFCYIDFLRLQIDSCETHLQDLEHVLCLDHFQMSKRAKHQEKTVKLDEIELVQTLRDSSAVVPVSRPKNYASPELKKKLFLPPEFLEHTRYCQCFFCTNLHYQQLTFSYSHVQAQLYSLLKYTKEADHYFHGTCKIKLKIDEYHSDKKRESKSFKWKHCQKYVVDGLLYLLDFSMFITEYKPDQKDCALDLIEETLEIAADNDMSQHCVSCSATELYAQHYVYDVLQNKLDISVPHDIPIDITNQQSDTCITPKVQIEKVTRNLRHRKSPPPIAIPMITVVDPSDEENDSGNSPKTKATAVAGVAATLSLSKKPKRVSARNVRRKLLADESDESPVAKEKEEPKPMRKKSVRLVKKSTGSLAN